MNPQDILNQMRAEISLDIDANLRGRRKSSSPFFSSQHPQDDLSCTTSSFGKVQPFAGSSSCQNFSQLVSSSPGIAKQSGVQSYSVQRQHVVSTNQTITHSFNELSGNIDTSNVMSSCVQRAINERVTRGNDHAAEINSARSIQRAVMSEVCGGDDARPAKQFMAITVNSSSSCSGGSDGAGVHVNQQGNVALLRTKKDGVQFGSAVVAADVGESLSTQQFPPPLPMKKKHVDVYMSAFGQYSQPSPSDFSLGQSLFLADFYQAQWRQHQIDSMPPFVCLSQPIISGELVNISHSECISGSEPELTAVLEEIRLPAISQPPALPIKQKADDICQNASPSLETCLEDDEAECEAVEDSRPSEAEAPPSVPSSRDSCDGEVDGGEVDGGDVLHRTNVTSLIQTSQNDPVEFVKGGPVDALIVLAASAGKNEFLYQEAFLTTYLTFIQPAVLIDKLLWRYRYFSDFLDETKRMSRSTFSLLIRVVDELEFNVADSVLQNLFNMVFCLLSDGQLVLARCLRKTLLYKCDMKRHMLDATRQVTLLPSLQLTVKTTSLLEFKSHLIAEQMTFLDSELFQSIEISEILRYSKVQTEESSPNLTRFTEHFNKMSYWCRSRILEREDPKDRDKYMAKFCKIMKCLRKLNNFNSYLALLSAVDSAPVRRLDWSRQTTDTLMEMSDLIDSSSSFRRYRSVLAQTKPPCIPYLGLILQDLTFVHIGNLDNTDDGCVNFCKRWQQFHILEGMRRFKKQHFMFKKDATIILFFNGFREHLSEEALWQLSEDYKPRGRRSKAL